MTKISILPAAAPLSGAEMVPIVQNGITKRATINNLITDFIAENPAVPAPRVIHYPDGAVLRTIQNLIDHDMPVTPYAFNADGTLTDDDTLALAAMSDGISNWLGARNFQDNDPAPEILFPGRAKGWRTTDTLALDGRCHIRMLSPLCPDMAGQVAGRGLHIINTAGESAPGNFDDGSRTARAREWILKLRRVANGGDSYRIWVDGAEDDIGVLIDAQYGGFGRLDFVQGFQVGMDICCSYSDWRIADIFGAQKGVLIQAHEAERGHFCNKWAMRGGEFAQGIPQPGLSRYGYWVRGVGGAPIVNPPNPVTYSPTSPGINHGLIEVPSGELGVADATNGNPAGEAITIVLEGVVGSVTGIAVTNGRAESTSHTYVKGIGKVYECNVTVLHWPDQSEFSDDLLFDQSAVTHGSGNVVRRTGTPLALPMIWDSGNIVESAITTDVQGNGLTVRDMEVVVASATSAGHSFLPATAGGWQGISQGYMGGYADVGAYTFCKRIILNGERNLSFSVDRKLGVSCNIEILCLGADGLPITAAGTVTVRYASLELNAAKRGGTWWGGVASASNLSPMALDDLYFSAAVKEVVIGFYSPIRSIRLFSPMGRARPRVGVIPGTGGFHAASIPVAVAGITYRTGQVCEDSTGATNGWRCTDGTAGTWVPILAPPQVPLALPYQHFAEAPANPVEGQTYYDTTLKVARTWANAVWANHW